MQHRGPNVQYPVGLEPRFITSESQKNLRGKKINLNKLKIFDY